MAWGRGFYNPLLSRVRSDAVLRGGAAGNIAVFVQETNDFRTLGGTVTSAQREIAQVNRAAAEGMQKAAVRYTYENLERPNVQTGRLQRALSNPAHISYSGAGPQFGFGVFDQQILDRSQAKYWRSVEYGTKKVFGSRWTGRMVDKDGVPLFGRWGGSIQGMYSNRWGVVPRAGAPFTRYGQGNESKLRPFPQEIRANIGLNRNPTQRRLKKPPKAPYRRKHVQPKGAFEYAWRTYGSQKLVRTVQQAMLRPAQRVVSVRGQRIGSNFGSLRF